MTIRLFEIVLSTILLPILLLIIIIFSLVLILELRQYPFFVQERGIVLDKFRFNIIKLRTTKGNDKKKRCSSKNVFFKPQFIEDVLKLSG